MTSFELSVNAWETDNYGANNYETAIEDAVVYLETYNEPVTDWEVEANSI